MRSENPFLAAFLITFVLLPFSSPAQQSFGGPYVPDSSTALLMHFNGDLQSDTDTDFASTPIGPISYIRNNQFPVDLGKQIYIDNSDQDNKGYVEVADHNALDLDGSWTIEMWFNFLSYSSDGSGWQQKPRLLLKPGSPHYHSNYFIYVNSESSSFTTGYFENTNNNSWQQIRSPDSVIKAGYWHHLSYIRDTTHNVLLQIIHRVNSDQKMELVQFESRAFNGEEHSPPLTNDNPLYIGRGGGSKQFTNGFIDELRISTTPRISSVPGMIRNVTPTVEQQPSDTISVRGEIVTPASISVTEATLHYQVNGGNFKTLSLTPGNEDAYTAELSPLESGSEVQYFITASTDYGFTSTAPYSYSDSDTSLFRFEVGSPTAEAGPSFTLPDRIKLFPNYPNPFNPSTTIRFALPESQHIRMEVYDSIGRLVRTLVDKHFSSGTHAVRFEAGGLSSGMYIYKIVTPDRQISRKMMLVQ